MANPRGVILAGAAPCGIASHASALRAIRRTERDTMGNTAACPHSRKRSEPEQARSSRHGDIRARKIALAAFRITLKTSSPARNSIRRAAFVYGLPSAFCGHSGGHLWRKSYQYSRVFQRDCTQSAYRPVRSACLHVA